MAEFSDQAQTRLAVASLAAALALYAGVKGRSLRAPYDSEARLRRP
jgi:hypothetical protein